MSTFSSPQNSKYLFIDMNSYFASCEQQANSSYRGRPVAVTPVKTANGCIVSASYEAKKFGIKTGTLVKDAIIKCPGIIICESNTKLYLDFHKKWVQAVKNLTPFVFVKSVDEAAIKLSPSERNSNTARLIAQKIKNNIYNQLGKYICSSVGIGPNIFLAKQASEYQKPNGLFEIKIESLFDYYSKIKLTDIKGINFRMEKRLNAVGLFRPIDLYQSPQETLKRKMGIVGEYWFLKLRGHDLPETKLPTPKSIGHSHVLEPRFRNWKNAWAVCQKLVEKAGYRLRSHNLKAEGVYLGIRFLRNQDSAHGFRKHLKTQSFFDSNTFSKLIFKLWQEVPKDYLPLKIAVTLFNLSKLTNRQTRLFESYEKAENISLAVDTVNDKYGAFTVKSADVLLAENSAPERISFGRPI
jgi:DNA polymerase-4